MKSMIDHNIDEQSVFSWAPKVVRKCESKHWFSCGGGIQSSCIAGWISASQVSLKSKFSLCGT